MELGKVRDAIPTFDERLMIFSDWSPYVDNAITMLMEGQKSRSKSTEKEGEAVLVNTLLFGKLAEGSRAKEIAESVPSLENRFSALHDYFNTEEYLLQRLTEANAYSQSPGQDVISYFYRKKSLLRETMPEVYRDKESFCVSLAYNVLLRVVKETLGIQTFSTFGGLLTLLQKYSVLYGSSGSQMLTINAVGEGGPGSLARQSIL